MLAHISSTLNHNSRIPIKIFVFPERYPIYPVHPATVPEHPSQFLHFQNASSYIRYTQPQFHKTHYSHKQSITHTNSKLLTKSLITHTTVNYSQKSTITHTNSPLLTKINHYSHKSSVTNPGPTTLNKKVWICDICHKQIHVRKQISIRCNRIEHWVHLRCAGIHQAQYTDTWTCHLHREYRLTHT